MKDSPKIPKLNKLKILGWSEREDVILESVFVTEEVNGEWVDHEFKLKSRLDITDRISAETGAVNAPIEWMIASIPGFAEWVEKHFQNSVIRSLSMGLRGDKYKVKWAKEKLQSKRFNGKPKQLAEVINQHFSNEKGETKPNFK